MKKFFSFIIRQSVAAVLAVAFVLGFGVYSTLNMPVNLLPDINVPMVCVQAVYAGAPAQAVEDEVTVKLEEGLSSIGGVTSVDSYSYDNLSAVVLSFDYGTDTKSKQTDILGKLSSLGLPDGVVSDVYDIDLNAEALAVLSLTSEKGLDDAYAKGKQLSERLLAIDGVESVDVKGGAEYAYCVRPYGGLELIAPLLVETFSYGGLDLPLGSVGADGVQIRNNSDIKTEEDIGGMPLTLPSRLCALFAGIREGIKSNQTLTAMRLNDIDDPAVAESLIGNALIFSAVKSTVNGSIGGGLSDEALKMIILTPFGKDEDGNAKETTLKVSDVASVSREPHYSSYVYYYNGTVGVTPGVTIEVYKSNGANSSAVVDAVKAACADASAEEGYTAEINLLDDQSAFISESISNVLISMVIGGVLAVLVIFLFLKKVKTSLIIAVTMPLSVLAAMICLYLMGITLNMVSLGGLAVGIGMLVDNSIVVIESISKHRDMDKTAFEAAVDGTAEVGGALFGSTLTTVCVFIPIIFAGGLTGEIFTDLSWAVIFSLTLSLIVAVTVIPALYAMTGGKKRMLKGGRLAPASGAPAAAETAVPVKEERAEEEKEEERAEKPKKSFKEKLRALKEPRIMNGITGAYGRLLPAVLKRRVIPILSAVIIFGASIGLLFLTGTEFLPSIDKGQIEVNMTYRSGVSLSEIQTDVSRFAEKIQAEYADNIEYVSVSVGKHGLLALTDTGMITVQLSSNRGTENAVNRIRSLAEEDTEKPEGRSGVSVKEIDGVVASLMSGTDDLSVTILGDDNDELVKIADEVIAELQKPENGFKDVRSSAADKAVRYDLEFDRFALAQKGIDYQTAVLTLRIGLSGYTACTATVDGETCEVSVSFDKDAVQSVEELENFILGYEASSVSGSASPVRIKDVVRLEDGHIPHSVVDACIRRADGKKMVSVSGVLPGVDTGTAGNRMRSVAAGVLAKHSGYSFQQSGISSYLNDAFRGLAVALVISFFLLYAVMAVQFGSAVKPLIIMASIPFSFTGGFIALVITRTSLNVVSFIGLIMLMGVVVNNAIVMLEKIKQLHGEGMSHYAAVTEACKVRLRPILMTTLTTILALIPLAIGLGQGAELMQPLGIVVIGGLLIGTLVTLVLVPAVYCAVYRLSEKFPEGKRRAPSEEKAE